MRVPSTVYFDCRVLTPFRAFALEIVPHLVLQMRISNHPPVTDRRMSTSLHFREGVAVPDAYLTLITDTSANQNHDLQIIVLINDDTYC